MNKASQRTLGLAAVLCASSCISTQACAQVAITSLPPVFSNLDANGVDLVTGQFNRTVTEVSIGPEGAGGLAYKRTFIPPAFRDNFTGTVTDNLSGLYTVSIGMYSDQFTLSGSVYTSVQGRGATLTYNSTTKIYTYTTSDGSVATFALLEDKAYGGNDGLITSYTRPNGEKTYYQYHQVQMCTITQPCPGTTVQVARLQSVSNNFGYELFFAYKFNSGDNYIHDTDWASWLTMTSVTAFNQGVEICGTTTSSTSDTCPLTGGHNWPTATFAWPTSSQFTVTDALSQTTTYTFGSGGVVTNINRPGSSSTYDLKLTYTGGKVSTISNGYAVAPTTGWEYSFTTSGTTQTLVTTDPNGYNRTTVSDLNLGVVTSDVKGSPDVWYYGYDSQGRLTTITQPQGTISGGVPTHGYTKYTYNSRGDVVQTDIYPISGSGTITTTATFPSSCGNPVICNKPTAVFDANGYETDYAWDSSYGVLTSVTSPALTGAAPANTGTRPQTRYSYASKAARYLTMVGGVPTMTNATDPVYMPTGISVCSSGTAPSCVGTANETATTVAYANTAGGYNNLQPSSVTTAEGDTPVNPVTATVSSTYDQIGNLASSTDPLTNVTHYKFDADRQLTDVIGPDPDGGGSLKFRAQHVVYNPDGFPTAIQRGTALSSTGWSTFASRQETDISYDNIDRKTKVTVLTDGTTQQITQFSYDLANRPVCTAVRLKLTSVPDDPCASAVTDSPDGPDRISKIQYNAADQVTRVRQAMNETEQRDYTDYSYTDDGLVNTVADGMGNLTTYAYDAYDRLQYVYFPVSGTVGSGVSSTTDYEKYTYDTTRITNIRRRDASNIGLSYYNTDWLFQKSPDSPTPTITYSYDLMGRLTSAANGSQTNSIGYDQLSRATSQTSTLGTVAYQYDAAGNRLRMTWPDSVYVTYDYDAANELFHIRESGATSPAVKVLATYTYDDLGRRVEQDRGNGANTTFTYTGAWLNTLTQAVDSPNAQTLTFASNAAGQFKSRASNNDTYVWDEGYNVDRTYAPNGLNQLVTSGTATLSYDALGNLASDGVNTYSYDHENRLTGVTGGVSGTLTYDALGRLFKTTGSSTTKYLYDGANLIAETDNAGNVLRRYVQGPGDDEQITWYEGSGVTNRNWFVTDEKGSVTAVTDSTGAATSINRYDEYGLPGSANAGRFQYTGQSWLADIGLYYYKARIYSPTLGRFLQTDPAGYGAGLNLYAYAAGDPANKIDPSGTEDCPAALIGGGNCPTDPATLLEEFVVTALKIPPVIVGAPKIGVAVPSVPAQIGNITSQNAPMKKPCSSPGPNFRCNAKGELEPTPEYQKKICDNFHALQAGATKANDGFTGTGGVSLVLRGKASPIVGALSTFATLISSVTTGAGYRPFGVTIIPPMAPPPGCN